MLQAESVEGTMNSLEERNRNCVRGISFGKMVRAMDAKENGPR